MKEALLVHKLNEIPNGRYFSISWMSEIPVNNQYKDKYKVAKITMSTVRKGIRYTNTKKYKESVQNKLKTKLIEMGNSLDTIGMEELEELKRYVSGKLSSLPWGKWKIENLIIEHTNKNGEYNTYLRLYTSPNKPYVNYFVNGKMISKEDLIKSGIVKESYWNKKSVEDGVFTIKTDNIINIYSKKQK